MLKDSEAAIIIVSTPQKAQMALEAKSQGVPLKTIITMTPFEGQTPEGVYNFSEIVDLGKDRRSLQAIEEKIARVSPEDIVSIIYTSGTTGVSKGAILTQKNFVVNIAQNSNSTMFKRLKPLDLPLTHLCHLPLCHLFGRTTDYHVGALHMSHVLIFPLHSKVLRKISSHRAFHRRPSERYGPCHLLLGRSYRQKRRRGHGTREKSFTEGTCFRFGWPMHSCSTRS